MKTDSLRKDVSNTGLPNKSTAQDNQQIQLPTEYPLSDMGYFSVEQEDLPSVEKAYSQLEQVQNARNFTEVEEEEDDEDLLKKAIEMSLNDQ